MGYSVIPKCFTQMILILARVELIDDLKGMAMTDSRNEESIFMVIQRKVDLEP